MKNKIFDALKKIVAKTPTSEEIKLVKTILTYLEVSYLFYQSAHWQTKGSEFYADHLLFQRLYEGLRDEIDSLGEKTVGVFGIDHVDFSRRLDNMGILTDYLNLNVQQKSYISTAILLETKLLDLLQQSETTDFSSGVKDLFAGFANAHEGNLYLLQQRQN